MRLAGIPFSPTLKIGAWSGTISPTKRINSFHALKELPERLIAWLLRQQQEAVLFRIYVLIASPISDSSPVKCF